MSIQRGDVHADLMLAGTMSELRRRYFTIALSGIIFFTALYVLVPWLRKPLVRENNILELLQVALYLTTTIWGLWIFKKRDLGQCRWSLGLIIVLSVFFVLEELSYGDTLFPIYGMLSEVAPRIHGVKIDALHDLFQVLYIAVKTDLQGVWFEVVAASVGVFLIGIVMWGRLYDPRTFVRIFHQYPAFEFVFLCGVLLFLASLIDLEIFRHHYLEFLEEILETLASLALLFSLLSLLTRIQSVASK